MLDFRILNFPLCFTENLSERIWNLIMAIDDKIKDEKLQYDINREASKISTLSSCKIDKYEYFTGGELLPFNRRYKNILFL